MSSLIRKDTIGQDINIGDIIAWGDSSRHSSINTAVVLKYNPVLLGTTSGNVQHGSCLVVTEQLKTNAPQTYAALMAKAEGKMETLPTQAPKKKLTYSLVMCFEGENVMPASGVRTFKNFSLWFKVLEDGQFRLSPSEQWATHLEASSDKMFVHTNPITREYEKSKDRWERPRRNGKLVINDGYSRAQSDNYLSGAMVKKALGYLPEDNFVTYFDTAQEMLDSVSSDMLTYSLTDKYHSGNPNTLGLAVLQG